MQSCDASIADDDWRKRTCRDAGRRIRRSNFRHFRYRPSRPSQHRSRSAAATRCACCSCRPLPLWRQEWRRVTRTTWVTFLAICCWFLVLISRLCLSETEWIHCLTEIWLHASCWCRSKHIFFTSDIHEENKGNYKLSILISNPFCLLLFEMDIFFLILPLRHNHSFAFKYANGTTKNFFNKKNIVTLSCS